MRERKIVTIDRNGAQVTRVKAQARGGTIAERVRDLDALVGEQMAGRCDPDLQSATLRCDGYRCQTAVALDMENPELPPGWNSDDSGDFCPACQP